MTGLDMGGGGDVTLGLARLCVAGTPIRTLARNSTICWLRLAFKPYISASCNPVHTDQEEKHLRIGEALVG